MGFNNGKKRGVTSSSTDNAAFDSRNVVKISDVDPELMEIIYKDQTAYFRRLRYKYCPQVKVTKSKGKYIEKEKMLLMHRDDFVRDMYQAFQRFPQNSRTGYGRFAFLCTYVSFWDERDKKIEFNEDEVLEFFSYRQRCVTRGELNKNSLVKERQHLKAILKEIGKQIVAVQVPKVFGRRAAAKPTEAISDKQFTDVGGIFLNAYKQYVKCIFAETPPETCPIFDPELAKRNGLSEKEIKKSRALTHVEKTKYWTNSVSRLALLITAQWTGANLTPLAELTKRDARVIKQVGADSYEFDSVKARAFYQRQSLGSGFTKRSKEFIESWLIVSDKIAPGDDAPLFPLFGRDGELSTDLKSYANPHKSINKKLASMGLPQITTRKFRTTRSSIVMRAFENYFTVAAANRNTPETTFNHYLEGVPEVHDMALARAFEVQKALVEGKDKSTVIEEFKAVIKDPFTSEEWKLKRQSAVATIIPTGVRCTQPKGSIAQKSLRSVRILALGNDRECISFLACFDCSKHALVAETDDIWLLLSFKDAIQSTLVRPSINSYPAESFHTTLLKVEYILSRMAEIAPKNFKAAKDKNKSAPHPLYEDDSDLTDLLESYA